MKYSTDEEILRLAWTIIKSVQGNEEASKWLFVLESEDKLRLVVESLRSLGARNVYCFPNIYKNLGALLSTPSETASERIKFLVNLESQGIFITEIGSLELRIPDPQLIREEVFHIVEGDLMDKACLVSRLQRCGFTEAVSCTHKQTYTVKGHIVDLAPQEQDDGIRIEIQDGRVVRLSRFNLYTQRSIERITSTTILPQYEFSFRDNTISLLESKIHVLKPEVYFVCKDALEQKKYIHGLELYNLLLMPSVDWTRFFSKAALIECNESKYKFSLPQAESLLDGLRSEPLPKAHIRLLANLKPLLIKHKDQSQVFLKNRLRRVGQKIIIFLNNRYDSSAIDELSKLTSQGLRIEEDLFCCLNSKSRVCAVRGSIPFSFEDTENRTVAVRAEDIIKKLPLRTDRVYNISQILDQLSGYQAGDYLVHRDFGICRFLGLEFKKFDGCFGELIKLQFADSFLYLPVDRINLLKKYASFSAANTPKLDSLSKRHLWSEKKQKAKEVAGEFAGALLKHFAVRRLPRGFQYPKKDELDDLFAADFEFAETADQLKATEEVLNDLASPRIMDRLICGDTGFGKTEVALRAAFKVLTYGKQVAVMCPTNLLCEQNFNVFKSRLEKWGFKVGKLNRFVTETDRRQTINMFNSGDLDCLVATTSLLSFRVAPKNLGLLIIDEEHKFGVRHKERFLNLPQTVDKLYLSATPLPRTLHLTVNDFRSLSLILTPPPDRKSHYVVVDEFSWDLVKSAAQRELNRGGKLFFVVSRVANMPPYIDRLKKEFGEELVVQVHGKMKASQLENAFKEFVAGRRRILVATNIVESGLDLRDVNTVIVADAERFGLAQLYQLKGRAGRSNQQGFVYFLFSDMNQLTKEATYRILALSDITGLGDSFRLATRDMEIRGVGELLGKSQKGKADLVGYETFIELVHESLCEIKASPSRFISHFEPEVVAPWPCFIPVEYSPDPHTRLSLYRKAASLKYRSDFEEFRLFLEDSFGSIPPEVKNLLDLSQIKVMLRVLGIGRLQVTPDQARWSFISPASLSSDVVEALEKSGWRIHLTSLSVSLIANLSNFEDVKFHTEKLFDIVYQNEGFSRSYFADA